tara:strand:+ start:186 stop:605 length:420 start_codon:yes stop_codon:yes gene_type:complete
MSAIIANYALTMKDAADPSTSTSTTDMSADSWSEIIPLERAFVGEIHLHFTAGRSGNLYMQVSNDFGVGDDRGVERINSENLITNWVNQQAAVAVGATDTNARIALNDIGARWGRVYWDQTGGSTGGVISSSRANIKGW